MSFIVSLTTHSERVHYLDAVVAGLLQQTVYPAAVVVNLPLGCEWVPQSDSTLPFALEVRHVEDLGPATKLIPSLSLYPGLPIVTIDDDVEYRPELFAELLDAHRRYPSLRIAGLARVLPFFSRHTLIPYPLWPKVISAREQVRSDVVPLGCEGVLYPPHFFRPAVGDRPTLASTASAADDLWFWAHGHLSQPAVVLLAFHRDSRRRLDSFATSLWRRNRWENSRAFERILREYPELRSVRSHPRDFFAHLVRFLPRALFDRAVRRTFYQR